MTAVLMKTMFDFLISRARGAQELLGWPVCQAFPAIRVGRVARPDRPKREIRGLPEIPDLRSCRGHHPFQAFPALHPYPAPRAVLSPRADQPDRADPARPVHQAFPVFQVVLAIRVFHQLHLQITRVIGSIMIILPAHSLGSFPVDESAFNKGLGERRTGSSA